MTGQEYIRNFCIIAHIDHGKSTLGDRLLEQGGNIQPGQAIEQILDANPISRERGITIKLAPVTMNYQWHGQNYQLNMIDTPGHVDFSYEVSRSLAACEGAVLVVDATQGIQAQTLSYWQKATSQGLTIIPVINKIDLPTAQVDQVRTSLVEQFGFKPDEILTISAKNGQGITALIEQLICRIPAPIGSTLAPLQALIFDSLYHSFKGVVVYLRLKQGRLDRQLLGSLRLIGSNTNFKGLELGIFKPQLAEKDSLQAGEVGYLATGLKDISKAKVGDTLTGSLNPSIPLPGYHPPQPVVFLNFFPTELDSFEILREGLERLKLNDASLEYVPIFSDALGKGFRCGFLGLLHSEIIQERLEREFGASLVATQPSVAYRLPIATGNQILHSASEAPPGKITVLEPYIRATIFTPDQFLGKVFKLSENKRGQFVDMEHFGLQVKLTYDMPLAEIIVDFFDQLKAVTSGFASFDYSFLEYRSLAAVRLDILIHGRLLSALSQIVPTEQAYLIGRNLVSRLKAVIPRQMFEFSIQAAIGGKVVAKETLKAFRKDVTAKLYGGDRTRKDKLLKKQAKGKKRMKRIGRVELPQEAFLAVLKR
jgi:GTP-binding protein LepA